ncbi:hypothetical protein MSG28_003234 [Choristoneura fumiferana]|uniref:Uncharacterized protein n=1 Tax=Choristoneura fumiferana TaxID=7141 RepID=A0ACC0KEG6_CHOFU|nr:hypothetical protein MSG28_003234 [Choristoneura fumiferana]
MLCSDACVPADANVFSDIIINTITLEVISEIQKELETCDVISLVFLLYDVPDTALQRLIVLQRVSKDIEGNHLDLLNDWALHAQKMGGTWRQQFLEALAVCQLYSILKKMGCHVPSIKERYSSNEPHMNSYINPIKIALYQLCENMTSYTFNNLKKSLDSFDLNVMQYDTCELVFLELMCRKFITVNHCSYEKGAVGQDCKVENITKIIDRFPEMSHYATMLKNMETQLNQNLETASTSTPSPDAKSNVKTKDSSFTKPDEFNDIYNMITELHIDDLPIDLKSDRKTMRKDSYPIKNKERVGQHRAQQRQEAFETRTGSTKDKVMLEKTMHSLNFDVITKDNLNRKEMLAFIQEVLQKKVSKDDSVFVLCILSHGIKGHVYAADSVAIKVDYIQNMLDDIMLLRGIPKVLILQACQVDGDEEPHGLAADGPQYSPRKTDFLVCWATAPELEAYRNPKHGSLFIQILCGTIDKYIETEHLEELFTKVRNDVIALCVSKKRDQVPICQTTLTKKLVFTKSCWI